VYTDGDLRRDLGTKGAGVLDMKLSSIMTKSPRMVSPDMKAVDAMQASVLCPARRGLS
jgi:CBS domain-containing protein